MLLLTKRFTGFLLALISVTFFQCTNERKVSFETLLQEMADHEQIARFPSSEYRLGQFSSYDRDMVSADDKNWFANWDRSMFLREEENFGRKEYVMFDTTGPGAVVRFWMTFAGEGSGQGILRFYLDGNKKPVIEGAAIDVLSGNFVVDGILASSVSDSTNYKMRGHNLYLPVPYAERCKITYESKNIKDPGAKTGGEAVYYNINYRTYENADVRSFTMDQLESSKTVLEDVQHKLQNNQPDFQDAGLASIKLKGKIEPGKSLSIPSSSGTQAIKNIRLKLSADNLEQALRSTILKISFDGEETVWCPVGDFFGTGYQIRSSNTWYTNVSEDGTLSAWWVMPFSEELNLSLHNLSDNPVEADGEIFVAPWDWDDRSMHFHTSWHQYSNLLTREVNNDEEENFFDINYVSLNGKGVYAGDAITLFNTANSWWGEGDEKVYIDGEDFPSHIGTGTEDYYGYAWCRPEKFTNHPFISQPDGSGNLEPGYTVNARFRGLDGIPFKNSLRFDMEMWHWAKTTINFAPVAFYYMLPGGESNIQPDTINAKLPVVLKREELIPPVITDDKIEAENMVLSQVTGGRLNYQSGNVWSNDMQVFWTGGKIGDKIILKFKSNEAGKFNIKANLTKARDYGKMKFYLNGQPVGGVFNAFNEQVITTQNNWGDIDLREGENELVVEIAGLAKDPQRMFFGLDNLLVKRIE